MISAKSQRAREEKKRRKGGGGSGTKWTPRTGRQNSTVGDGVSRRRLPTACRCRSCLGVQRSESATLSRRGALAPCTACCTAGPLHQCSAGRTSQESEGVLLCAIENVFFSCPEEGDIPGSKAGGETQGPIGCCRERLLRNAMESCVRRQ